jgi:hypothetical protein
LGQRGCCNTGGSILSYHPQHTLGFRV